MPRLSDARPSTAPALAGDAREPERPSAAAAWRRRWARAGRALRGLAERGGWLYLALAAVAALQLALTLDAPDSRLLGPVRWFGAQPARLFEVGAWVALAAVAGALVRGVIAARRPRWEPAADRVFRVGLGALVFVAGWSFFSGVLIREKATYRPYDTAIYGLGAKYFDELGYEGLNRCAVQAVGAAVVPDRARVRDLRTYGRIAARELRAGPPCRPQFEDARWAEFLRDLERQDRAPGGKPNTIGAIVGDKGMNGPPTAVALVRAATNAWWRGRRSGTWLAYVDVAALCLALAVANRRWGFSAAGLAALVLFCSPLDRFAVPGGSFFRYLWLACLVVGIARLSDERWRRAGFWLAASASLAAFPALFAAGAVVARLRVDARRRGVSVETRQLLLGLALGGGVGFVLGSSMGPGLASWSMFFENMRVHATNGPHPELGTIEAFQGYGVGLKWAFAYRGVHFSGKGDATRLTREFREVYWLYRALGVGCFGLLLAASSGRSPAWCAGVTGFGGLFLLAGAAGYYMSCAMVIVGVGLAGADRDETVAAWLLLASVAICAWAAMRGVHIFVVHRSVASLLWTAWLIGVALWSARRSGLVAWVLEQTTPPASPAAASERR